MVQQGAGHGSSQDRSSAQTQTRLFMNNYKLHITISQSSKNSLISVTRRRINRNPRVIIDDTAIEWGNELTYNLGVVLDFCHSAHPSERW